VAVDRAKKDMKKKITVLTLCATLFALSHPAHAQQIGKIFRIGFLDASTASGSAVLVNAFRQELSKLGWIEGKNIAIEYRFAEQKPERAADLVADLVRLKVDLILVTGTLPALAAKRATSTIPIVMANVGDPTAAGLVASLAARRQCHWALGFSDRTKHEKARRYSRTRPQARLELDFCSRREPQL
jgi:putative ABC transport system substrate-binding protein